MTWKKYVSQYEGKSIAVLGLGVSNIPLARMLLNAGLTVSIRDRRERAELGQAADEMESMGARLILGDEYLCNLDEEVLFRSPGIMPHKPEIASAVENGAVLTSEMEAFFEMHPCTIIGVTGSDGKTTTTTIISEMLKAQGKTVHVGGNIGTPLLDKTGKIRKDDYAVLELSSFQLITMKKSADIAVVTNVTPNHLDVHTNMHEYTTAKMNIYRQQRRQKRVALNYDNETTRGFATDAKGDVIYYSRKERLYRGAYIDGSKIIYNSQNKPVKIMDAADIRLPGAHVVENYLAAIAAIGDIVSTDAIQKVAREFGGVEHRIEYVETVNDVRYFNDSAASSPARTAAGLRSFENKVILIAGGRGKGVPFDELATDIVEHVKTLVLTGETAAEIRDAVLRCGRYSGTPEILMINDFDEAIIAARKASSPGDTVLFSPACTSFDRFKNASERGNYFKMVVNNMMSEQ